VDVSKILKQQKELEEMTKPLGDLNRSLEPLRGVIEQTKAYENLIRSTPMPTVRPPNTSIFETIERARAEAEEAPTARRAVKRILAEIQSFQAGLDDSLDVGIQLVSLPHCLIHVESVGYYQPNLVVFYGHIEGTHTRLVQHLSQLNFVLTSVRRENPDEPRREIGFHVEG
jgi:hypothetical protein